MSRTSPSPSGADLPETFFAPARRATADEIKQSVQLVSDSPVLDALLETLGGWVTILNEQRQVLAVNHALLEKLGVTDPASALGLRPGEALGCVHAHDHPGGCGTSRFCVTCGAAISIVASLDSRQPQERECVMTVRRDGVDLDLDFIVRSHPLDIAGAKFLLVCMRDISQEKRRMALERAFLHDIANILTSLSGASELIGMHGGTIQRDLLDQIRESSRLLAKEVRIQRLLSEDRPTWTRLDLEDTDPEELLQRLRLIFSSHPAAKGQTLFLEAPGQGHAFRTDTALLLRVLTNMVTNAFEAGTDGDHVRVRVQTTDDSVTFRVWNRQAIPEPVALRVFQRYYSTKAGNGRGMGTFAIKLLGESLLGGKVDFTSSEAEGTTFSITLPRNADVLQRPPQSASTSTTRAPT
ncbi:MAG: HAMP domain-containing histidine kinase [Phycisphaerae bacterium]|nr:HAMP domain-containing histidine kinase [Phycisphaerae bacterium]